MRQGIIYLYIQAIIKVMAGITLHVADSNVSVVSFKPGEKKIWSMIDLLVKRKTCNRINDISIGSDNIVKINTDLEPTTSEMDFSNGVNNG